MLIEKITENGYISTSQIKELTAEALAKSQLQNKRILIIIPDLTRNAPIDLFFEAIHAELGGKVKNLDYLIAAGTHQPMDDEHFCRRVGITVHDLKSKYGDVRYFNHYYNRADHLVDIGSISEEEIFELSDGLLREKVNITINKLIFNYDQIILLSPVVPHETVGFSGGNKYFFPGISGAEFISFFHWLGAVITNFHINGTKINSVRKIIERAARLIKVPRMCFSMVVVGDRLKGLFIGSPEETWSKAADLSAKHHIKYMNRPFSRVLGIAPSYYDDLWVAGKVMYKLEPVIADDGELVLFAPHVKEISFTHGELIHQVGYHVRDYFLKQIHKYSHIPRGILAHSTNVKGSGTFDDGIEKSRIHLKLATAIPEEICRRINLGYHDPATINFSEWRDLEHEGILFVDKAGGTLYRIKE